MEHISDYDWFCANCLRMVEVLSRHGRCPFCDSNAVDVAFRWSRPGAAGATAVPPPTEALAEIHT